LFKTAIYMTSFIKNINTYLVERYPNIWNTRLFWVIGASLIIHFLFFLLGYIALNNPESLHRYRAEDVFFNSGAVFFSVILSILIFVIWLVYLLKNNAFKAFYPTKQKDLFIQFCCYFISIFFCTSFFLSYSAGLKTYINTTYPDNVMVEHITTANDAALFLSHSLSNYTIDNKRYPDFYFDNFCETNHNFIDYKETYYSTFEFDYQFYSVKSIDYKNTNLRGQDVDGFIYKKQKDSVTYTYFFKDIVIEAKPYIKTLKPSYYNYSETFYNNTDFNDYYNGINRSLITNEKRIYQDYKNYTKERYLRSKQNSELLDRNNPEEIKTLLNNYLEVAKLFKIEHNLNTEQWFKLVYHPSHFEVTNFIKNQKPPKYPNSSIKELTQSEKFVKAHNSKYYILTKDLKASFNNIDDIKASTPFQDGVHVFIWIAFVLSLIIFMFRVTDLRTLLFSIVSTGVITMLVTLIMFLIFYVFRGNNSDEEYIASYLSLFVGASILSIPWFFYTKLKKIIVGICLNISLAGFLPFLLLIMGIISMHQADYYRDNYPKYRGEYTTLIESLGIYWSFVFLIIGFVFIYFYSATIKKWKALTEG